MRNERITTSRLAQNVLSVEGAAGEAVLFVHGNVSSAAFWRDPMLALADGYRPLAVDLRGFGESDPAPVDATRGVRDYSDDVLDLVDTLGLDRVHVVGWSLGGGVVLQALLDRPEVFASVTLVNPVSPYGFGGTEGEDGKLTHPDGTGSGAGGANPDFVKLLVEGDRGDSSPLSPRNVFRTAYVKPGAVIADEDYYVESMLTTRVGEDHYPGEAATSENWPGVAPGTKGVLNTIAPTHFRLDLAAAAAKPPILWIRGADDVIVSDTSLFDLAYLGVLGVVPGSPGTPAQPMVSQTRAALTAYGPFTEVVLADCGHSPHLEKPEEFLSALRAHLAGAAA
ncbi:alpha/beta fold hydrolase [Acrocarpospora catenulata]|uniref:alpha/beta fold hydrolase n=1 Tax=Acrocarpospora catenulata TaxID=2836182 RepID=UPI001BDADAB6|nr:alpha/beta hydrolase [Acrocarpospora catenulata]